MFAALITLASLFLFYLLLCLGVIMLEKRLVFKPAKEWLPPADARFKKVRLKTNDGLSLIHWFAKGRAGAPTILYLHGTVGYMPRYEPNLIPYLDAGCGVFIVEYRGYGQNPGTPSEDGLFEDALAAMKFLRRRRTKRIIVHGFSLGTAVATRLAAFSSPQALIIEAGFSSIAEVGRRRFPASLLPLGLIMRNTFNSLKELPRLAGVPLLQCHGGIDRLVPLRFAQKYFENYPCADKRLVILKSAHHHNLAEHGFIKQVLRWKHFPQK